MIIGYARVSSDGQSLHGQLSQLRLAGAERTFSEKESGARADRKALSKALQALQTGDVLLVCKLDRLARSVFDLLGSLKAIEAKGASLKSLSEPWADTSSPHSRLLLQMLASIAEFERHLIRSRCADGIKHAKARGVRFGRPAALTQHQQAEARARRSRGESLMSIAASYNVSHSTISRLRFPRVHMIAAE
jgi:DNA invertase Pin-like site-specific DNA recombinase